MGIPEPGGEFAVDRGDARGPIGRDLLAHRQVQTEVQKRILAAALRRELRPERLGGLQQRYVFGVFGDERGDLRLERLERLLGAILAPRRCCAPD